MLLSRDELIATLFRETDRAQRMKTPLALILCRIDVPASAQFHPEAFPVAAALRETVPRITQLLRCYDSVGETSEQELALVLPGCTSFNAVQMSERLNASVFGSPIPVCGKEVLLSACFGVAGSGGRSSLVVLRNAEQALRDARDRGAGSIERCTYDAETDSASFLMPVIENIALR